MIKTTVELLNLVQLLNPLLFLWKIKINGQAPQLNYYNNQVIFYPQVDSNIRRSKYWPRIPSRLTYKINEIIPNLLKRSIEIVTGEKIRGQRVIIIKKIDSNHSSNQQEENQKSDSSSDDFIEPLSSYINLNIHRIGSSDIFECENCSLTGDIHFMKDHPCKQDLTILDRQSSKQSSGLICKRNQISC